jgi:acyl-coenzyme A thioesterase PaaI-like protein
MMKIISEPILNVGIPQNQFKSQLVCPLSSLHPFLSPVARCLFNVYHHKPLPANVTFGLNQLFAHPITSSYGPFLLDTLRETVMTNHRVAHSIQSVYSTLTSPKATSLLPRPPPQPSNLSSTHESLSGYAEDILQLRYRSLDPVGGKLVVVLPYRDEFVGNFSSPCLHGGVLGSLLDHCGYYLAQSVTTHPSAIESNDPTEIITRLSRNDYRVDYLLPAPCFEDILCDCIVTHRTEDMIWIDGICWNQSRTKKLSIGRMTYQLDKVRRGETETNFPDVINHKE